MADIVLTDEQVNIVTQTSGNVVLRDSQGRHLGYVSSGFTAKEIAEARSRLATPGPRFSTADVLARLQDLDQK